MDHVASPSLLGLLRRGIESGLWSLETLDTPSNHWLYNIKHADRRTFPRGYIGIQHRNLLRDQPPQPRVEVSDPRDFDPSSCDF
jgi:hypothetical protein